MIRIMSAMVTLGIETCATSPQRIHKKQPRLLSTYDSSQIAESPGQSQSEGFQNPLYLSPTHQSSQSNHLTVNTPLEARSLPLSNSRKQGRILSKVRTLEYHLQGGKSNWDYYLFFESSGNLVCRLLFYMLQASANMNQLMMGPENLGSTATLTGTWDIIFRLHVLMEWGTTEYRTWFETHILGWCKKRCSSRQDMTEARPSSSDSKVA